MAGEPEEAIAFSHDEAQAQAELERGQLRAQILAQGQKQYGIFADDLGALKVFYEIEWARDQFTLVALESDETSN